MLFEQEARLEPHTPLILTNFLLLLIILLFFLH